MDGKTCLLLLATVLQVIHLENLLTNATDLQPTVEIVSGHSTVFLGDTVRLRCIAPVTSYNATWTYTWFHGTRQLSHFSELLIIPDIKTKQRGKYYCQAFRETSIQDIPTLQSQPAELKVDGGWAILDAPSQGVVGLPLSVTCRVRSRRRLSELVLYRDGVEVLKGDHPVLILDSPTLQDEGMYSCRASWIQAYRTHSVISASVFVQVVEPLTQPELVIVDNEQMRDLSMLKLVCVLEYNIPAPAPPIIYYFYLNNNPLGRPTSENFTVIKRSKGSFTCQAKVSELNLSRWSEPESF